MYDIYKSKGLDIDTTATTIVRIDGLDFECFEFTLKAPNGTVVLNQLMYAKLINGHSFGVNINYNNKKYKKEMLKALFDSQFRK
ncbi:hypothetical protein [Kordia sp.]|uniref:hypothetical protein n=1 Tax=Kordia sp. TaxID=1965332 RepID=UPI0025BF9C45|nr:hypothetical protein [Kordia sp.]MCH2194332.1 hypothetical protein [Kordia sp.]